jgi:hypothetical protein
MLRVLTKPNLPTAYPFYFFGFELYVFFFFTLELFLILYFQPDNSPFQAEKCRGNITFNTCGCSVAHTGKHTFSLLYNFDHTLYILATYDSHNIKLLISEVVRQCALCEVGNGLLSVVYTKYFIGLIIEANHNRLLYKR